MGSALPNRLPFTHSHVLIRILTNHHFNKAWFPRYCTLDLGTQIYLIYLKILYGYLFHILILGSSQQPINTRMRARLPFPPDARPAPRLPPASTSLLTHRLGEEPGGQVFPNLKWEDAQKGWGDTKKGHHPGPIR